LNSLQPVHPSSTGDTTAALASQLKTLTGGWALAANYLAEDCPELCADQAVDQQVDRGVDHEEDVREEPQQYAPHGKSPQVRVFASGDVVDYCDLMHIQDQPWQVADDEDGDDQH